MKRDFFCFKKFYNYSVSQFTYIFWNTILTYKIQFSLELYLPSRYPKNCTSQNGILNINEQG